MNQKAILYGIIGLFSGILLTILFTTSVVNSNNTGMMRMMGMNTEKIQDKNKESLREGKEMHNESMTMDEMSESLKDKSGDEFDKSFIELMIEHHEGAIDMAGEAKKNAKHDEIKNLANDIITAQTKEIEMMKEWEKSWEY